MNIGGPIIASGSKKSNRQINNIVLSAHNVNYEKPPLPQARDSSFGPVVDYHDSSNLIS